MWLTDAACCISETWCDYWHVTKYSVRVQLDKLSEKNMKTVNRKTSTLRRTTLFIRDYVTLRYLGWLFAAFHFVMLANVRKSTVQLLSKVRRMNTWFKLTAIYVAWFFFACSNKWVSWLKSHRVFLRIWFVCAQCNHRNKQIWWIWMCTSQRFCWSGTGARFRHMDCDRI